ncbi:MAG: hypothetical protein BGO98_03660 [Myxococcales bacterium 68-20]|nr:MAG: hypothetical protein BGO98_03660 [Myxococcales bacterium 68-20]
MKWSARRAAALGLAIGAGGIAAVASHSFETTVPAPADPRPTRDEAARATFVGAERCAGCHTEQTRTWRGSDHAHAMKIAGSTSIAGDFEDRTYSYAGTTSSFRRIGDRYEVATDGADGGLATFPVTFSFGERPLQQYLVPFGNGRLQALPIAWDTRPKKEGGQRWFHVYPNETTTFRDALHWTGPSQCWNTACGECHVTSFQKAYRAESRTYESSYAELGVSCEACHGPGSLHLGWAARSDRAGDPTAGLTVRLGGDTFAWSFDGKPIASRVEPLRGGAAQVETCARCHSRRMPIWSELHDHRARLADTHRAALLEEGLYFPDGQIEEEVYEYASFLQSKMHARGVVCTNCHDPHSGATRQQGNALCHQCHAPASFDTPAHTMHVASSPGSRCIACHMPSRVYMRIDLRRDHSFRIPRPDLAQELGTPDACTTSCHSEKTSTWAAQAVAQHYPAPRRPPHYGQAIAAGRAWKADARERLLGVVRDDSVPAIVRATAIVLLQRYPSTEVLAEVERAARAADPLVRRAAASVLESAPKEVRRRALGPLLVDAVRTVRLAAVMALAEPAGATTEPMARAIDEARASFRENADRADSLVELANLELRLGRRDVAERELRTAIELQSAFVPAYVNLADLLREGRRDEEGAAVLERGLATSPDSAVLRRALGLALVRGGRTRDALSHLAASSKLAPDDPVAAYVWAVALRDANDRNAALRILTDTARRFPGHEPTRAALAAFAGDR